MPKVMSAPAPLKEAFIERLQKGGIPPLFLELPYRSPAEVYPAFQGPGSFLLESVKGPFKIARHSFIGFEPYAEYRIKDGNASLIKGQKTESLKDKPFSTIKDLLGSYKQSPEPSIPPFQGGAVGLLNYDFVHYLEKIPVTTVDDLKVPDAHFLMVDRLIAFDHQEGRMWAIVCPGARHGDQPDWNQAYDEAVELLENIRKKATEIIPQNAVSKGNRIEIVHDMSERDYCSMVDRVKEYIAAGDIFQANISLRVHAALENHDPWDLYTALRKINPAPFASFMNFGDYHIVSSSPERLVKVSGDDVQTRPIAGTRPRGTSTSEDDAMRNELLLNEKERAEHIMLIDLERNDIGRVCDYGSVHVDELMITEDYSHVIHIVSNVRGRLARGKTSLDVIKATFPGGTITGVPKVRCMEIIDELEPFRRGPYTGSLGYIGFSGDMDLNIIIRTFTIKNGVAYVQAGAGIVADSEPSREYKESLKKAEALITTLERVSA